MLERAGTAIGEVSVIGGGAQSALWGKILAAVLDRPLVYREGGELGPAFGAARLARLATTGETVDSVCVVPPVASVVEPDTRLRDVYVAKLQLYRRLYGELRESFRAG